MKTWLDATTQSAGMIRKTLIKESIPPPVPAVDWLAAHEEYTAAQTSSRVPLVHFEDAPAKSTSPTQPLSSAVEFYAGGPCLPSVTTPAAGAPPMLDDALARRGVCVPHSAASVSVRSVVVAVRIIPAGDPVTHAAGVYAQHVDET